MKLHKPFGILAAITLILVSLAITAFGQTQTNTPTSFIQTVGLWFTSFNTNYDSTFRDSKGSAWAGVDSLTGSEVPIANEIGLSYTVSGRFSAEAVFRDGGVTGTMISSQAGVNYAITIHDAQLIGYADAGWNHVDEKAFGEVGLRVRKALTEHTFAQLGLGVKIPDGDRIFSVSAGFVF